MPHQKTLNIRNEMIEKENDENKQIVVEQFDSYIKRIIKNEIVDYKRKKARLYSQEISLDEVDSNQIAKIEGYSDDIYSNYYWIYAREKKVGLTSRKLYEALRILTDLQIYILISLYVDDETQNDVANRLNISRGSLRYQNEKALDTLKKHLCIIEN